MTENSNRKKTNKKLSRREVLKYGLYGGLTAGLSSSLWISGCSKQPKSKGPNVVMISIDTLRADHLTCYGYKRDTTPNIDRLAFEGHRFTNAYTTIPTTLPAHASMFSSLYPRQLSTQRNGEKAPDKAVMLAEILEDSGYTTAAFVSAMVMDKRYGSHQGFQSYNDLGSRVSCRAEETLDKATVWLNDNKNNKKPFFLFTHFFDPHTPYYAPESFRRRFGAPNVKFLPNPPRLTDDVISSSIAAYDAEIAYADWAIGELMKEMKGLGLDENTVVILVSDHGESLDELIKRYKYSFDHGEFIYAHQLHVPLIIRMPKSLSENKAIVHTTPVSLVDVTPTILDVLGIEKLDSMVGRSLSPALRGEKLFHGPVFSERRTFGKLPPPLLRGESYSVIEGKWHLIFSSNREDELYNLADDPRETTNLLGKNQNANALRNNLRKWLEKTGPLFGPSTFETDRETIEKLRSLGYTE